MIVGQLPVALSFQQRNPGNTFILQKFRFARRQKIQTLALQGLGLYIHIYMWLGLLAVGTLPQIGFRIFLRLSFSRFLSMAGVGDFVGAADAVAMAAAQQAGEVHHAARAEVAHQVHGDGAPDEAMDDGQPGPARIAHGEQVAPALGIPPPVQLPPILRVPIPLMEQRALMQKCPMS